MRRRSFLYGSLAVAAAGLLAACGDDPPPTSPTKLTPSPFAAIQVMGPDSIGPGQSAQFVANIRQADGTTKSATMPNLRWASSNTSVLFVSSSGVVTAPDPSYDSIYGEAVITAELICQTAVRGTREVVVQPEGTYRIIGSVRQTDAPTVPIVGARVEVLPGSNFTLTDSIGQYRLYGVPPQSTIRITAAGYETLDEPLQLTANVTRNFDLNVNGPRLVLTGGYALTLESASSCNDVAKPLAVELRRRSYDATLTQDGSRLQIVLTDPRIVLDLDSVNAGRINGTLTPTGATFVIARDNAGWFSDVMERLPDGSTLQIEGTANTTGSSGVLSGALSGWFSHQSAKGEGLGECNASRFTLSLR